MKSIIKRTIYAGLGLLGDGTTTVRNLGKELARKANVSEVEGEKIARKLQAQSRTAVKSIRKTLDVEVAKIASAMRTAINADAKHPTPPPAVHMQPKKVRKPRRPRVNTKAV
jgi:hypothetical protein